MYLSDNVNIANLWASFNNEQKADAFASFYKSLYGKLYAYSINLGVNEDAAKDIIQDLFVKLYTHPSLIKNIDTIDSFLFVSVRNSVINWQKRSNREQSFPEKETFEFAYTVEQTTIEDEEERKLIQEKIDKIMSVLTPRQREIIYLRFLHQMRYDEIATIMGLSEQSARNLAHRSIKKVQASYNVDIYTLLLLLILFLK